MPVPVPIRDECGGREEIRTLDLLRAREALSQLSYPPTVVPILPSAPGACQPRFAGDRVLSGGTA